MLKYFLQLNYWQTYSSKRLQTKLYKWYFIKPTKYAKFFIQLKNAFCLDQLLMILHEFDIENLNLISFQGIAMSGKCIPLYQMMSFILLLIILILSCVALGCICKSRKDLTRIQRRMKNKRASSWNRVQEAMKQRSGAKQKPPVGKNGWV